MSRVHIGSNAHLGPGQIGEGRPRAFGGGAGTTWLGARRDGPPLERTEPVLTA